MSVTIEQPEINLRNELIQNKQRFGVKGKQLLESESIEEARTLIGVGRKNLLINGGFDIWQRGTNFSSSSLISEYGPDRWHVDNWGNTRTVTKEYDDHFGNFKRTVIINDTATSSFTDSYQYIEFGPSILSKKTVTFSFYAKTDANQFITAEISNVYGTGGTPSANDLTISNKKIKTTAEWRKYYLTCDMPDISTKTIGTNNNHRTGIQFWFSGGSAYNTRTDVIGLQSGTFDIANVQLEIGDQYTEFEQRHISEELSMCQRYYQKSYDHDVDPGTLTNVGQIIEYETRNTADKTIGTTFKTTMRTIPTITLYSPSVGTSGGVVENNGTRSGSVTDVSTNNISAVNIASGLINNSAEYQYTADAEL